MSTWTIYSASDLVKFCYIFNTITNAMLSIFMLSISCIFKGLSEEGLFRLPGQAKNVAELKDAFNRGTVCQITYKMSYGTMCKLVTCSSV